MNSATKNMIKGTAWALEACFCWTAYNQVTEDNMSVGIALYGAVIGLDLVTLTHMLIDKDLELPLRIAAWPFRMYSDTKQKISQMLTTEKTPARNSFTR